MKQANKRWQGFTIVEILLVVVILAVIAALAVPNFGGTYTRIQLRKTADDLAYRMRYAQSYAITKNTRTRLEFDPSFTQYWLTRESDTSTTDAFERIGGRLGESAAIARDMRVSFADGDPSLYFYPDATMDKKRIDLCRGEECVFISTQEQRGQVYVSKISDERP